jgi:hypothetical protein
MNEKLEATTDETVKDDKELEQAVEAQAQGQQPQGVQAEGQLLTTESKELDNRDSKGTHFP